MDLTPFVEQLRQEFMVAAEAGGEESRALAEYLISPLSAAVRLMLLEALSVAAAEITSDIAPGSVDVRLRGRDAAFVVALPPPDMAPSAPEVVPDLDEAATARINFRLPEHLKTRVEQAAAHDQLSVNAWLGRVVAAAVAGQDRQPAAGRRGPVGQRITGWAR
jgi:hypothetical protein